MCTNIPTTQTDPRSAATQATTTVQLGTVGQGTAAQGEDDVSMTVTIVIASAAVLGSILGLVLVGGAVILIICFVLRRSKELPTHEEIIFTSKGIIVTSDCK